MSHTKYQTQEYKNLTLTLNGKDMFCPHLFKFRQLLYPSATNHVMFEVKLFCIVPQKAIPQHPCTERILLLLIP